VRPLLLITALVVTALCFSLALIARQSEITTAQIAALSARVTAVEDSVSRLRPLQASHNALARRVNGIDRQAGRVFLTQPLEEESHEKR